MRSLYESSGLSRIALGLQAWPRTVLRGRAGAPDSSAEYESLFPARNWWEFPNLSVAGIAPSAFTEIAEARFAGVTATVRSPASAADEPAMSQPNVLLGSIPSAAIAPTPIGSSTPPPAVAVICGCGYFLAPTQVLDQLAANAAHVHLSGQLQVPSVRRSRFPADRPDRDHGSLGQCADVFTECCSYQRLGVGRRRD